MADKGITLKEYDELIGAKLKDYIETVKLSILEQSASHDADALNKEQAPSELIPEDIEELRKANEPKLEGIEEIK